MIVHLNLERSLALPDFPSGSSINYRDGKLFLIGDDANNILVLDSGYGRTDSKKLFDFSEKRIPKPLKSDLETSTFIAIDGKTYLMVLGSASTDNREKIFIIPFIDSNLDIPHFRIVNSDTFASRLLADDIHEVNIEGSTVVGKILILSNRGNRSHITNHLVITEMDFWNRQSVADLKIIPVKIPLVTGDAPGVSELCYVDEFDLLLIAFSSEGTANAYDDGAIGHSYIGWIENITQKIHSPILTVDEFIDLSDVHQDFKNEKIEGLCVESVKGMEVMMHLVSDNDNGESKVFKVKMTLSH